jgi:hypothetical protein
LAAVLAPGMRIRIVGGDGRSEDLRVTASGEDYAEGTTRNGRIVRIEREQIRAIDRRAFAAAKTAGLIVGIVAIYVVTVVSFAVGVVTSVP